MLLVAVKLFRIIHFVHCLQLSDSLSVARGAVYSQLNVLGGSETLQYHPVSYTHLTLPTKLSV